MDEKQLEVIVSNEIEWRKHLVTGLESVKATQIVHGQKLAGLSVKSGIWGALGSAVVIALSIGAFILRNLLK